MKTFFAHFTIYFISLVFFTVPNMSQAIAAQESEPSGVLYFSNGREIEKLELKARKREVVIPDFDGKIFTESIDPVFSRLRNKMYFFHTDFIKPEN